MKEVQKECATELVAVEPAAHLRSPMTSGVMQPLNRGRPKFNLRAQL